MKELNFTITGQLKGGKSNMQTDPRSGRHYPKPEWAKWRDLTVIEIKVQIQHILQKEGIPLITIPCEIFINYHPGDKRKRDVPGMEDALWHIFEDIGIVDDDSLLAQVTWRTLPRLDKSKTEVKIRYVDERELK